VIRAPTDAQPVKLRSRSTGGSSGSPPLYVNSSAVKAAVAEASSSSGSSSSSSTTSSPITTPRHAQHVNGFELYANQDIINAQRRSSKLGADGDGAAASESPETQVANAIRAEKFTEVRLENQMLKQALAAAQVALFAGSNTITDGSGGGVGLSGMISAASLLSVRSNSRRRSFEVPIEALPDDSIPA